MSAEHSAGAPDFWEWLAEKTSRRRRGRSAHSLGLTIGRSGDYIDSILKEHRWPSPDSLTQIAEYFDAPDTWLTTWQAKKNQGDGHWALCACGCGRRVLTPISRFAKGHNARMPQGEGGRERTQAPVLCRRCKQTKLLSRSERSKRTSLQAHAGRLTYLCRECQSRDRLATIARPKLLTMYGISSADNPDDRLAAMQEHLRIAQKKAGGPRKVREAANAARQKGLSERGRQRLSMGLLANSPRFGEFRLCPRCHKLIYLDDSRIQRGALGFHLTCYRQYQRTDDYRRWRDQLGSMKSPTLRLRLTRFPHPMPPRPPGRAPTTAQLALRLHWLLRHTLLRHSWGEIAASEGYARSTISGGVHALIDVLPEKWTTVFGGRRTGRRLDELLPITALRAPPDDTAA